MLDMWLVSSVRAWVIESWGLRHIARSSHVNFRIFGMLVLCTSHSPLDILKYVVDPWSKSSIWLLTNPGMVVILVWMMLLTFQMVWSHLVVQDSIGSVLRHIIQNISALISISLLNQSCVRWRIQVSRAVISARLLFIRVYIVMGDRSLLPLACGNEVVTVISSRSFNKIFGHWRFATLSDASLVVFSLGLIAIVLVCKVAGIQELRRFIFFMQVYIFSVWY